MKAVKTGIGLALVIVIAIFGYCATQNRLGKPARDTLERIRKTGTLTVLTRNAPTTYYQGATGTTGFEYEMVQDLAAHLNAGVRIIVKDTVSEILSAIEKNEADIAAAAITKTRERGRRHLFGPEYYTVQQQVVYRRGSRRPRNIADLTNRRILVIANSSYHERLLEIKKDFPALSWETTDELSTEQVLEKVWRKEIDCAVADSNIVAVNRRYFPELAVAFPLGKKQSLAWVLSPGSHGLQAELKTWFNGYRGSGKLAETAGHHFGATDRLNYVDIKMLHRRIKKRLPNLKPLFTRASHEHRIPWGLLAAQAYQESHWNNTAKSPTGVRGIMMLTKNTAQALGVENRLNPEQSIQGGAKYLSRLIRRVPKSVNGENRLKYALAAYNVGMGHIYDARKLSRKLGKNPDSWQQLRETLPLLTQKKYYKSLKYGYARGMEPVRYVSAVYSYWDIIENTAGNVLQPGKPLGLTQQ